MEIPTGEPVNWLKTTEETKKNFSPQQDCRMNRIKQTEGKQSRHSEKCSLIKFSKSTFHLEVSVARATQEWGGEEEKENRSGETERERQKERQKPCLYRA